MKIEIAGAGDADPLDSCQREHERRHLRGNLPRRPAKWLGELKTCGKGEIAHLELRGDIHEGLSDLETENLLHDLHKPSADFLLDV
jgi:hypothetical protein